MFYQGINIIGSCFNKGEHKILFWRRLEDLDQKKLHGKRAKNEVSSPPPKKVKKKQGEKEIYFNLLL